MARKPPPKLKPPPRRGRWAPEGTAAEVPEIDPRTTDDWVFVHKLENFRDEGGNELTRWFSEAERTTSDSDTPPSTRFLPLIDNPGDYRWAIFGNGRTAGLVTPTWGSVSYKNAGSSDGETVPYFDPWIEYATDGAKMTCWWGPREGAFPAEFRKVFIAYVDGYPDVSGDVMTLRLRGREKLFDRKLTTLGFDDSLGTENGVDLETAGIPGAEIQQIVMGQPPPFKPILTNAIDNVWLLQGNIDDVTVNAGVPKLYDGGGEITYSGGIGTSQGGGTYRMLKRPHGPIMVQPVSSIRVELRATSSGLYSSPTASARAWTICDVATLAGVAVDVTMMAAGSTNYGCGNRLVKTQTAKDVLNDIAGFQVASIGFTRLDEFYAQPIVPSFDAGSTVYTFRDSGTYKDGKADKLRFFRLPGMEKRIYRMKVRGGETTKSAMIGDVVIADAVRDALARDGWMATFTVDHAYNSGSPLFQRSTILDTDPTAEEMEVEILSHEFPSQTEMLAFAERLFPLHGSRSIACEFETFFSTATMNLGRLDPVRIETTRFGGARNCILIGGHARLKDRRISFTGWSHREDDAPTVDELTITQSDETVGAGGGGTGTGSGGGGAAAPQLMHEFTLLADKTSAIAVGESVVDFIFPFDGTLTAVFGGASTAQTSGSILTLDMKINAVSVLSVLITVDNNERSSHTAATGSAISAPSVLKGDRVTFHVTQAGTGGKGPWVDFVWYPR